MLKERFWLLKSKHIVVKGKEKMKQLQIDDIVNYIERANYGPVEMTPSFSTDKRETIYNKNNEYNGESVVITDVCFENENIRITLKNDGTWTCDLTK